MFIFTDSNGAALVADTNIYKFSAFSFPELDQNFNALTTTFKVVPRPVISVVSTLGGHNYLNVFGEDPLTIDLQGIIVGNSCTSGNVVSAAIATAVQFYSTNGVVNRVTPIKFQIEGDKSRKAFLVAMTVVQDNNFIDVINFNMMLLAESLDKRELASATVKSPVAPPKTSPGTRALTSNIASANTGAAPQLDWPLPLYINSSGEVTSPETQTLLLT